MNNPFAAATAAPNPFGGAPNAFSNAISSAPNPFGSTPSTSPFAALSNNPNGASAPAFGQPPQQSNSSSSPFGQPFQSSNNAASPFGQPFQSSNSSASPFAGPANSIQKRKNAFEDKNETKRSGTSFATIPFQKANNFAAPAPANISSAFGANGTGKNTGNGPLGTQNKRATEDLGAEGRKKSPSLYAQQIHDQLRRDNLKPPPWPKNPGAPENLKAVDDYRVKYRTYESKVRASLIKAGLIDDPEVRKTLSDAIDFRGICEDMCPEGEKVSRIVEHDVKQPERFRNDASRDGWANPDLMVKSFKRSAAGVDSPLPTEVRSPATLRRTVDYLIDDLLQGDENLPFMHGFLWDRTRAIRKDFIFQNAMTPEERIDQIYCLENITRFHAVSLHLLSKDGKADFSEQQEREQLGKTLLSLIQVYDECKDMDITIDNEAEFRAYFLLFNAHDPFVIQQMQDWNDNFWFESPEIQTAVSLIHAMQNIWNYRGPLKGIPLTIGSPSFNSYFSIVEQPEISYTMACVAEIHFTEIRRLILKALHKSYARIRGGPKDLTAKVLNEMFRFDTEEECVEYLTDYGMEFSTEGATEPYMVVVRRRGIPQKTVKQSSSQMMVERKRGRHSFPDVVHNTVFEEASSAVYQAESPNSLFVTQPDSSMAAEQKVGSTGFSFKDNQSSWPTPAPTKPSAAPPPTAFSDGFSFLQDKTMAAPASNPFLPQLSNAPATTSLPATEKLAAAAQPANSSWTAGASSNVFQTPSTPGPPKQAVPTFSWSSAPGTTPTPAKQGTGGMFDFLNKSTEQPQAPVFAVAALGPGTTTSFLPAISPVADKHESKETTSNSPTISVSLEVKPPQDISAAASSSIFAIPTTSPAKSAPFSFISTVPASIPSARSPLHTNNLSEPASMTTLAQDPVPAVMKSAVPAPKPPPPAKDMMGDLAKWVLLGDYGMMEQLEEKVLEGLLRETYEGHQKEERERRQRAEDERALAEALAFRTYSLSCKYLNLWRHNARRKFARNAAKKNSIKMKEWREEKAAEAKAEKIRREREERARQKRLSGPTSWLEELDKERSVKRLRRESMSLDTSRRTSPVSDADALLATGIFDGLPNKQQYAASAVRDDDSLYDALVGVQISPASARQVMGPPAKPVKDPLRSVRDGGISKQPSARKWSKKAQELKDLLSGSKKEDDLLSFRSSTSSRLGRSVRSAPGAKVTNFSKYQSSSPRSSADFDRPSKGSSSGIKSSYWLLKRRGLFATPAGHVLSERAPRPQTGSAYDNESQYSGDSENGDYDDRVLEQDGAYRASLGLTGGQSGLASRCSTFSHGAANSPPRSGFMKPKPSLLRQSLPAGHMAASLLDARSQRGEADAASQADSAVSTMPQDVEETLRELRKVAAEMDEDTEWYRSQNGRMSQGRHVGG
ncbi:unnamed protein product [Discula destructiva]